MTMTDRSIDDILAEFVAPCPGCPEPVTIEIRLGIAEQRALAEAEAGGPCFRMWLTAEEAHSVENDDWTVYPLRDGRFSAWRKQADVDALMLTDKRLAMAILARKIDDTQE
jgi:hypothetical protein